MAATSTRRERLRAATVEEIEQLARQHLARGGPAAISLRAIARQMGMTPGAIYSYYDTRDALVAALVADVYGALADALEAARDSRPMTDPAGRLVAVGRAYRGWAIARPEEFRLVYGDALSDYRPPGGAGVAEAEHRACGVLLGLVAAGWGRAAVRSNGGTDGVTWSDFSPGFAALARASHPELSPAGVASALRLWGRMHGLVALEVYGHLGPQLREPAKLYDAELDALARDLGLVPGGDPHEPTPLRSSGSSPSSSSRSSSASASRSSKRRPGSRSG